MPIDRDMMRQVVHMLRPLAVRMANSIARGVVQLVNDSAKMQLLQVGVLADETIDGAEHFHPVGLASVPLAGSEAVVLFPNGDRAHPLVVAVSDRANRPAGGEPGQITLYSPTSAAKVIITADGDIEVQPAPGREVFIREDGGSVDRLVKKSEYDDHTHPPGTFVAPSGGGPVTGVSGGAAPVAGTQRLRAQ